MDKRYLKWYLVVGVLALLGSQLYVRPETRGLFSVSYWQNLLRYGQVMRLVESEYVDASKVDYTSFTNAALDGGLSRLDPYSRYFTAEDYVSFNEDANQVYVGVGIEVGYFEEKAIISDVFPYGSASEAGVEVGDWIVGVDAVNVESEALGEVIEKIRGEPGSDVSLTLSRIGAETPVTLTMERREIALDSVTDIELVSGQIGYLRIRQFIEKTDTELSAAVDLLIKEGATGLIVDLRGNPGGRLDTAARMAELFLDLDQTILKVESRRGVEETFQVLGTDVSFKLPMAVLIDGQSASASEIFAGALQDYGRAIIVGETSFGKGSVQSVFGFSNGDGMKLTSARYLLPKGAIVQDVGVVPDIEVEMEAEDRLRYLLQSHLKAEVEAEDFADFFGFSPEPDKVLEVAIENLSEAKAPVL